VSTTTDDREPKPKLYRKLWGARVLRDGHVLYWWAEIVAILLFYLVYSAIRNAGETHAAEAFEHAKQLMSWQRALGLNHEQTLNAWALHFRPLVIAANYYYGSLHFIVTIGVGVYLFRKWPDDYPRWRNTLGIATAIALIGFRFWPLMPPRLLDAKMYLHLHPGIRYHFVDTLDKDPAFWTFNSGAIKNISNQFAAMPSVHCCWALWCACADPAAQARVGKVARRVVPRAHGDRDRDHREPLLPRRDRRLHDLRRRLHRRPARHPRRPRARRRARVGRDHLSSTCPCGPRRSSLRPMIDLDHVAIATTDIDAALRGLVGDLGGTIFAGGDGYGFRWVQTRLGADGAGMTVEMLVAWEPQQNDFLARFLARHGPGQHHLTFKVTDLAATLDRVHTAGFRPVSVDLRDPEWKEAFLQPREAHGTVVQLAQVHPDHPGAAELVRAATDGNARFEPEWWPTPPPRAETPATLERVVMSTPSLPAAVGFFAGLLDGEVVAEDDGSAELVWPGSGRVRIELDPDAPPGFRRVELSRRGPTATLEVSGAPFLVAPV
jgi:catechol 2,3-dioxygenase-like lactoylglutathione lyase family enzyme